MKYDRKKGMSISIVLALCMFGLFFTGCSDKKATNVEAKKTTLDLTLTNNAIYLDEANYADEMQHTVLPYINLYKETGFMPVDEGQIYYEQYVIPDSNRHVVVCHGFTEFAPKYSELIYYFLKNNYNVSILEHMGHGQSTRLLNDAEKTHIETYDTYIQSLNKFIETIVKPSTPNATLFLYGHSMGGAISAMYLENYPNTFTAAVLSSPMMEIDTGNYPVWVTQILTNIINSIGKKDMYIFGHGPYEARIEVMELPGMSVSREQYVDKIRLENPERNLGGGTFGWLKASLEATSQIEQNASKAITPKILFQSELDTLVKPNGQDIFAANAPNTTLIFVPQAQHELYLAKNSIMIPYFNTIFEFFGKY